MTLSIFAFRFILESFVPSILYYKLVPKIGYLSKLIVLKNVTLVLCNLNLVISTEEPVAF